MTPEDDLEEDPALVEIINAAEKDALELLKDDPMNGGWDSVMCFGTPRNRS